MSAVTSPTTPVPPSVPNVTFMASADGGQTLAEQIKRKRQIEEAERKRRYALRVKLPIVAVGLVAAIYFLFVAENERSWGLFVLAATALTAHCKGGFAGDWLPDWLPRRFRHFSCVGGPTRSFASDATYNFSA